MNGAAIMYGDVAPGAKENFVPSASEKADFVDLSQLQKYNLNFPNYANPCELYQTTLDGSASLFPDAPESENLGLWSNQLSGADGTFADPIVLTLTANGQYSSQGLTFTFDTHNNIFCTSMNIKWFRDLELLADIDFAPDNPVYFCRNKVENYDKVIITFNSINMPQNRLKLHIIDYGYGTFFYGEELRNIKLIQEIDPISSEIAINTCDFTLDSKSDMEYSFQAKQPLNIYFNGELKATTFVKTSKRKARRLWEVQSEDYIGLLDSIPFKGGMYRNIAATDLLSDIFAVAKVPFNIESVFGTVYLSGYIPYTTCREALMQAAFAAGAVVDTSNSDVINVYTLSDEVTQTIPLRRIMQGQSFTDEETVTGVEVTAHAYSAMTETVTAYDATESGAGFNIVVIFSEPLHDLAVENGEIISCGVNYAVINADETCVLTGQKYEHTTTTKRIDNPLVLASEIEKIVAVEAATLVTADNVDSVAEKCYAWLTRTTTTSLKIVEGKHVSGGEYYRYGQAKYGTFKYGTKTTNVVTYDKAVNVGEVITSETEYLGSVTGRIIKQTFNLNGGIIIKETELR